MNFIIAIELKENEFNSELQVNSPKIDKLISDVRKADETFVWPLLFDKVVTKGKEKKYLFCTLEKVDIKKVYKELDELIENRDDALNLILPGDMYRALGMYLSSDKVQFGYHHPRQTNNLLFERDFLLNEDDWFANELLTILLYNEDTNKFETVETSYCAVNKSIKKVE